MSRKFGKVGVGKFWKLEVEVGVGHFTFWLRNPGHQIKNWPMFSNISAGL